MAKDNGNKSYEELARNNQVTLSDGRVVTIDLYKATWVEITSELSRTSSERYEEILSRMTGLTVDEIKEMPFPDGKLIDKKLSKALRSLNDFDPN